MVDLGCTGRKDGQTDSTRTREKKERKKDKQSRAVEHYWQEAGRHTSGGYDASRETEEPDIHYTLGGSEEQQENFLRSSQSLRIKLRASSSVSGG